MQQAVGVGEHEGSLRGVQLEHRAPRLEARGADEPLLDLAADVEGRGEGVVLPREAAPAAGGGKALPAREAAEARRSMPRGLY